MFADQANAPLSRSIASVVFRRAFTALCSAAAALALAILLGWLLGRGMTDRYAWSQWLWWIPTPALFLAGLAGLALAFRSARAGIRRRRKLLWSACCIAILIYFAMIEHRLLRSAPSITDPARTMKLVHWNITHRPLAPNVERVVDQLVALDGDVTVITNPSNVPWQPAMIEKLGAGQQPLSIGTLALVSRFPILDSRILIALDGVWVIEVELDASATLDRPIILYLVDLPSNPRIPRMDMARRIRQSLDDATQTSGHPPRAPDLVVGDFNITRGSASLQCMFPNMNHAFDQAGHAYGATFHRRWPLWHIDHVLIRDSLRALRYDLHDPGLSRHRIQTSWMSAR